jgi:hypothetical protein
MNKNGKIKLATGMCMLAWIIASCGGAADSTKARSGNELQHETVFYEDGKFAAWPANGGIWTWDNEILVCFTMASHVEKAGHTYDVSTARNMFARSMDGGETWTIEDAFIHGITGYAMDHRIGDKAEVPGELKNPVDFSNPDFAFLFQRETNRRGPAHFYYSYDRGRSWSGPYAFPELDREGITNRTDYIIDSASGMTVFLSIGHGRTAVARTGNGGLSWELISYIGPDFTRSEELAGRNDYSLMPSSVRLSSSEILTTIRHREGDEGHVWITGYISKDSGYNWLQLVDPVSDNVNSPPALVRLPDGTLILVYIFRQGGWDAAAGEKGNSKVCARISRDNGHSWSNEIVLRQDDGANNDVGYPRAVLRPDGKIVLVYYWNHSLSHGAPPYRYIAATIWDPEV